MKLHSLCIGLALTSLVPAQADPEAAVVTVGVEKLNDYAKECYEAGYPDRAEEVWREVLAEYDTNDPTARKALGYKQVGKSWALDPEFRYPEHGEATLAKARTLRKRFESVAEEMAKAHLRAAEALAASGATERANHHYDRVLRFQPGHAKAAAARQVEAFDGLFGTATEIAMLKRIRVLRRAVAQVNAMSIKVDRVADLHEALAKTGLPMVAFSGPNLTCYGDVEPAVVEEAVRVGERMLALCKLTFEGYPSFTADRLTRHMCFCKDDESWSKVLEANAAFVASSSLDFVREHKPAMTLTVGATRLAFARAPGVAIASDLAGRWVAQSYCEFKNDGLVEGIGHAMVGMLLGRNLSYIIGQDDEEGTVASRSRKLKLQVPDLDVWQELAIDTAWENTSVPAAQLPFLKAAAFPTEGRIKAWSFCHFLLLRDPLLLRKLDDAPGERVRTPYELRREFVGQAGVHIDELDQEWRVFWTRDTPLLRAVRGGEIPALEGVSEEAFAWVDALNELRKSLGQTVRGLNLPHVHWSESYSEDCKLHVDYLDKNKSERGPGEEDTQKLDKPEASPRGKRFAESAIVVCGNRLDPAKAVADWLAWPGYRHAVLDPRLNLVGAYATKSIAVLDVVRGMASPERGSATAYPFDGQKEVPNEVTVADLGDQVRALLEAHGAKGAKKVGFPISVHMYGGVDASLRPEPDFYRCELMQGKEKVPGVVCVLEAGPRRAHAKGLAVFYPLQPLKRGTSYSYQWTMGNEKEGRPSQFTTR